MLNLIQSEWLKLAKRPLSWMLLAVFLLLLLLQYLSYWLFVTLQGLLPNPAQAEDFRQRLMFPGTFGAVFSHVNGLGGIFAVVLAAGCFGGDYSWGTLRIYLARQPNRIFYLLAKIIALLLALLVAMLMALALGSLVAVGFGVLRGEFMLPSLASLSRLPVVLLRALLVLLPYVLATVAATVYGRSLIVGLVAGLLFQLFDITFGAVAVFARLGGIWHAVYNLMVQANISTLTYLNSIAFGLDPAAIDQHFNPSALPSLTQAVVVVGVYSALFLFVALRSFQRQDVTSG